MSASSPELIVQQLTRTFPTAGGELDILTGVDLELRRGETLAITGPSGSGKSTLLYLIGLLDPPTSGTLRIGGDDPLALDAAGQARFRNRRIGFVFQDHHLLPQCNVLENVLLPTIAGDGATEAAAQRARSLLERVGLAGRMEHRPGQLSGGERQRVAVCRALINQPLLLLADEPTGNLDHKTSTEIGTLLLDVAREQQAVLICVTHSRELAARFGRHLELQDGRLTERPEGPVC
ncbi:MAG: ABC transporter ATP-binding protein [Planctomycetaceae bacterium]